ncbi:GAF and ANTAR domain-containing protein [uncultured Aeromicrobium sp.]|uniref:GAF and ANTAR domain-containing protein n=1 Tax=uncultured Aeromicrobium sp. TaxID=337820 RepID=UPI0025FF0864|nr:GAF and ANTAR domain-containing protein [uncultured Aeromicrobium sp.]
MDIPEFFSQMALDLHTQDSTEKTVDLITRYARSAIGCDDAGLLLVHARSRVETAAATSQRVRTSHELQRTYDEGPCLDALEGGGTYVSDDVSIDERWPTWGPAVAALGICSVVSVRLETAERRYGSLNLYSEQSKAFDDDDLAVATIFARHASVAVASAQSEEGLRIAIDARKLIGQAQGILMERFDIDADRAFDVLRRYSQHHNRKLREVAEWVVTYRRTPLKEFGSDA